MSYSDQTRGSSPASIAVVVVIHLAIGYAFISGLAFTVIKVALPHTTITEVPKDIPPPPPHPVQQTQSKSPKPMPDTQPTPKDDTLKFEDKIIQVPPLGDTFGTGSGGGTQVAPLEPPRPSQAHDAVPGSDRLRWIRTEDYPAAALREGIAGTVVISAMIGTDGRVQSCLVTQSSGSQLLDDATCRLYTRRGHFTPARDADGNPTTAQRSDRFRWQIPNE